MGLDTKVRVESGDERTHGEERTAKIWVIYS